LAEVREQRADGIAADRMVGDNGMTISESKSNNNIGYKDYENLLGDFLELLKHKTGDSLISVVLYGSVARGGGRKDSDIDILIIIRDASRHYYDRLAPVMEVNADLKRRESYSRLRSKGFDPYLSFLILSAQEVGENKYIFLDMIDDGILMFDKDGFFEGVLGKLNSRLKELGSKKVYVGDKWYWDLKPDLVLGEEFEL
jgi:predicted nucleotidyltransferase